MSFIPSYIILYIPYSYEYVISTSKSRLLSRPRIDPFREFSMGINCTRIQLLGTPIDIFSWNFQLIAVHDMTYFFQ